MRSHVTDSFVHFRGSFISFNTASGMRSHVTNRRFRAIKREMEFQYRKRYEITCDFIEFNVSRHISTEFQYRKRYEITCDVLFLYKEETIMGVSIPQAV